MIATAIRLLRNRASASAGPRRVAPETRASATARLAALHLPARATWTARTAGDLTREGFERNPLVYRAIRMIAESAASVPLLLYEGRRELETHPLLDLLLRPNAAQSGAELLETVLAHLHIAGNAYIEVVTVEGETRELHALRPERMSIELGPRGWPDAYGYSVNGQSVRFDMRGADKPILHLRLFHPRDDHFGLSPLQPAAMAIDLHNAGAEWAKALLDNSARPSGALIYEGSEGRGNLTEDQFERLRAELEASYQGRRNAGRPLLLEGGLRWAAMSLSPQDMDFIAARQVAAREIAFALGVPPMLLGIPGDNTYSNYREANSAFWRLTVLPLLVKCCAALGNFLGPRFGPGLRLAPDLDAVEALSAEREALWTRISQAAFLSDDEKRAAVGYGSSVGGGA